MTRRKLDARPGSAGYTPSSDVLVARDPMHTHAGQLVIAEGATDHLKNVQKMLARAGVTAEIVAPPAAKCSS